MRIPRIYHPVSLQNLTHCILTEEAGNHIARVLRMQIGDMLTLFDGSNWVFESKITHIHKRTVSVTILSSRLEDKESPLNLHLGQVISRGEKMEFTIQKSVELGVNVITPLWSSRCGVKLDESRMEKKIQQWRKIAISACEQCGRNRIPEIRPLMHLDAWCREECDALKLNLHPRATYSIKTLPPFGKKPIRLLIGSEGGLSQDEIQQTVEQGFTEIQLGKRVLRTETSALTAITALQVCFGDI